MDLIVCKETLESLGCRVVIVSFGLRKGAERWKEETNCPFPVFLDEERKSFGYFGMQRSMAKVFGRKTRDYFVGGLVSGNKKFISPYEGIKDDPLQMGGDFVSSSTGGIVFSYPSNSTSDRPKLSEVIQVLKCVSSK